MTDELIDKLIVVDPLVWARTKNLQIREGIPFEMAGTPYLADLVMPHKVMTCIKGSQLRVTTTMFLSQVHACIYGKYRQNVMYMMPTVKQVEALSKISFDPILDCNPWLKKYMSVNTISCKTFCGRSIYFVGAQPQKVGGSQTKDSPNLRSIPCDIVIRDEIDLMDEDMVNLSSQRLRDSELKLEANFASPTYPNYGIDALYQRSTMNKWQIKCRSCGKFTCLPETFPDCILKVDGVWRRSCIHCKAEIFVIDGVWVPEKESDEDGYWIDGLLSPRLDLSRDMPRYFESEGTARAEFMRSVLGIATAEASFLLTDKDVYDRCTPHLMRMTSTTETVMGVDIGEPMYCVVGVRTGDDTYEIILATPVNDFTELHSIASKMNVKMAVLDSMPDIHASREFQKKSPFAVFRCQYSEQMPGQPVFDGKTGILKCNRNEWCDKVYDQFVNRKIAIPARCKDIDLYTKHMTQTAKTLITNPETGLQKPRWIKMGDDHYFHATVYFLLGASRTSPRRVDAGPMKRYFKAKNQFVLH